jgi:hypothetical protein
MTRAGVCFKAGAYSACTDMAAAVERVCRHFGVNQSYLGPVIKEPREGLQSGHSRTRLRKGCDENPHGRNDAAFGIGHPEKVVDFAFRAVHEMAVKSKAIVSGFYAT